MEQNRPSVDIGVGGDVLHDATSMRLRYALRMKRVEWWAGADRVEQDFTEASFRTGTAHGLQSGVTYLGFGRRLAPELVVGLSRSRARADELDMGQRRAQLALRYTPISSLSLTGRFELLEVAWGVERPEAGNYRRRDRRRLLSLQGQVRLTRQAAWTLAYDRWESRSTRAARGYASDYVSAALTVKLGSTSAAPRARGGTTTPAPVRVDTVPVAPPPAPAPVAPPASLPPTVAEAVEPVAVVDAGGQGVTRVETVRRGADTETVLRGEGLVRYSTLDLDGPPRFVVDLVGVAAVPRSVAVDTPLVRGIRIAAFRTAPSRVARVVFDLKAPVVAHVEREGDRLRVILRPAVAAASAAP